MTLALTGSALLCGLLALAAGAAMAQTAPPPFPPRLRVAGPGKPIEVASLDARVAIHGLHAETTQTVVFHNPNDRVLEGDLEFPLPDGATVAGFALDVDGVLADAVVVTKEKARVVLETEVRKGADPGLVEQVRGNLYRARVYPIPARGNRTVRLRWVSELTTRGSEAAYHLPLPYDRPIAEVALRVEVIRAPVKPELEGGFGNLTLTQWDDRWVAEAKWQGAAPSRDLLVRLPKLPAQLVALEPLDRETYFSVSDTVPERAGAPRKAPKRIALAWDSSGSRTAEATERELAFLEKLLKQWSDTPVDLVVFRDRPERPRAFDAGSGRKQLFEALRGAPVDGGTALAALDLTRASLPNAQDELWIVCSDGLATLGEALPRHGDVPVWTATGSSVADRGLLRALSAEGGGELVDLIALDAAAAVTAVAKPGARLLFASASPEGAVAELQIARRADRGRVSITGRLLAEEAELTLSFSGGGSDAVEKRSIKLRRSEAARAGDGPGPVATAWAQGRVEALAVFADRNAEALLALGRRFGLVTPGTSLLVLETLAQHLEHGVEPAPSRAAMRAGWLAQIGEREKAKQQVVRDHLEQVVAMWRSRVEWWEHRFEVPPGWRFQEQVQKEGAGMPGARADRAMPSAAPPPSAPRPAPVAAEAAPDDRMAAEEQHVSNALRSAPAKKAKREGDDSAEASIAIKAWDPQVPYLAPLRSAPRGQAYAAYLEQKKGFAGPAFFLDCAELLLRGGEKELGLRVLSNLAELRLDDPALLRVLAWRLSQAGELDLAAGILEKVLRLRPEEPQSKRDLALVLADRAEAANQPADAARATDLLYDVVLRAWDRFPEIELIALMEVNRILVRAERRGWAQVARGERVDPRLKKLLDVDLRVSLSWDADATDVDLHLFEPTGEHAFFSHNRTAIGGLVSRDLTQGYGPEEYLVRRAVPGDYAVKCHYYGSRQQTLVGPATVIATVFTNWGRPDEKRQVLTLRLDSPRDMEEVGVVTIGAAGRGPRAQGGDEPQSGGGGLGAGHPARTLAPFRALRRGMTADQVTAAVGQPDAVGGAGGIELKYRLGDGSEVHVKLGAGGVASVAQVTRGAELELLP